MEVSELELKLLSTTKILLDANEAGNNPQGGVQSKQDEADFVANIQEATGKLEQLFRAVNTPMELANIEKTLTEGEYAAWQLFRAVCLRLFRRAKKYQIANENFSGDKLSTERVQ